MASEPREIIRRLSVSERSVERWTKDARKHEREQQQARVWDLWLDRLSERDVAAKIGVSHPTVSAWVEKTGLIRNFTSRPHPGSTSTYGRFRPMGARAASSAACRHRPSRRCCGFSPSPATSWSTRLLARATTIQVENAIGRIARLLSWWASPTQARLPQSCDPSHDDLGPVAVYHRPAGMRLIGPAELVRLFPPAPPASLSEENAELRQELSRNVAEVSRNGLSPPPPPLGSGPRPKGRWRPKAAIGNQKRAFRF
jgi:hypothetical protein